MNAWSFGGWLQRSYTFLLIIGTQNRLKFCCLTTLFCWYKSLHSLTRSTPFCAPFGPEKSIALIDNQYHIKIFLMLLKVSLLTFNLFHFASKYRALFMFAMTYTKVTRRVKYCTFDRHALIPLMNTNTHLHTFTRPLPQTHTNTQQTQTHLVLYVHACTHSIITLAMAIWKSQTLLHKIFMLVPITFLCW